MHEAEGAAHGLRCIYQRIDLDRLGLTAEALPELLTAAERMGFAGLNITHPCKQTVMPFLTDLSDDARAIGSVNTVVFDGGRRVGHNTDRRGFRQSVQHLAGRCSRANRSAGRRRRRRGDGIRGARTGSARS